MLTRRVRSEAFINACNESSPFSKGVWTENSNVSPRGRLRGSAKAGNSVASHPHFASSNATKESRRALSVSSLCTCAAVASGNCQVFTPRHGSNS
jgi:hypothetical protein